MSDYTVKLYFKLRVNSLKTWWFNNVHISSLLSYIILNPLIRVIHMTSQSASCPRMPSRRKNRQPWTGGLSLILMPVTDMSVMFCFISIAWFFSVLDVHCLFSVLYAIIVGVMIMLVLLQLLYWSQNIRLYINLMYSYKYYVKIYDVVGFIMFLL